MNKADKIRAATLAAIAQRNALVDKTTDELAALYKQAADELTDQIRGDAAKRVELSELHHLLSAMRAIMQRLRNKREALLDERLPMLAIMAGMAFRDVLPSAARISAADRTVQFVRNFTHSDGLQLSDRLWRLNRDAVETVGQHLQAAVSNGESAFHAVMRSTGAGEGVPPHIAAAYDASRAGALRQSVREVMTGAPDPATGRGVVYQAERLFRTELIRAHGEAYIDMGLATDGVVGMRFMLSPRHPKPDICDTHASADLYGLGPGVYPTREACPWPAHPNTFSYVEAVFEDEIPQLLNKDKKMDYAFSGQVKVETDQDYEWQGRRYSHADFIGLAGAADGARLVVVDYKLFTHHPFFEVPVQQTIYEAEDGGMSLFLYTDLLVLKSEFRGQGFATSMLRQQVDKAIELGFSSLALYADGGYGQELSGYYTWPRLGFNADIPAGLILPNALRNSRDILDIMSTPAGREWWKKNGIPVNMEFNLEDDSKSLRVFRDYLNKREE